MDKEGHIIGNHSYSHSGFFDFYRKKKMQEEIIKTNRLIESVIGKKPLFFALPMVLQIPILGKHLILPD